jgi:hypothetical protein
MGESGNIGQAVQPWGKPPTPLFPAALRDLWPDELAPAFLRRLAGREVRLGELDGSFWERYGGELDDDGTKCLAQLLMTRLNALPARLPAFPFPVDPSLALSSLPFRERTRTGLSRGGYIVSPEQLCTATTDDLLSIVSFGATSLLDLLCVIEAAARLDLSCSVSLASAPRSPSDIKHRAAAPPNELPSGPARYWNRSSSTAPPDPTSQVLPRDYVPNSDEAGLHSASDCSVNKAIDEFLHGLDERERSILLERVLAGAHKVTLEELALRFGVTRERVRQIEARLRRKLQTTAHREPMLRRSEELHSRMGAATPAHSLVVSEAREWALLDFAGDKDHLDLCWALQLHVAGPYLYQEGWLIHEPSQVSVSAQLAPAADERGVISFERARALLLDAGLHEAVHDLWISRLTSVRRTEHGLLRWDGSTMDKLERLLRLRGRPTTAEELIKDFGEDRSHRGFQSRMIEDPRFVRINKQNEFALREWGFDEYTGITDEIAEEITRCGGAATAKHLITKISDTYKVSPNSVAAYINAPRFVKNATGEIRLRRPDEVLAVTTSPAEAGGCYLVDGRWTWRVRVDRELLRGSGRPIPAPFAAHAEVQPGGKRTFPSTAGQISLSWPLSSIIGPTIGSLRAEAEAHSASEGDYLFVSFDQQGRFTTWLCTYSTTEEVDGLARLALLVGFEPAGLADGAILSAVGSTLGLTTELSCTPGQGLLHEIKRRLHARGERLLADLLPAPVTETIDDVMRRLAAVLP